MNNQTLTDFSGGELTYIEDKMRVYHNQPPTQPSIELKEIVKNTLNLTEAGLINVFNQLDNHCFETLNDGAKRWDDTFSFDWENVIDLQDFINEVRV